MSRIYLKAIGVLMVILAPQVVAATGSLVDGPVTTRLAIQDGLGEALSTEAFENWGISLTLSPSGFTSLDSSTIVPEVFPGEFQGPGIVGDGLRFTSSNPTNGTLQLDRRSSFGLTSGALLSERDSLVIDFLNPVTHVGLDYFTFRDYPDTSVIHVYAADGVTLLYTSPIQDAPEAPGSAFFGYVSSEGIGQVRITSTNNSFSPLIDNLDYGYVPEPGSVALLIIGLTGVSNRRMRN